MMGIIVGFYAVSPDDVTRCRDGLVIPEGNQGGAEATVPKTESLAIAELAVERGLLLESVPINSMAAGELFRYLESVGITSWSDGSAEHSSTVLDEPLIEKLVQAPEGEDKPCETTNLASVEIAVALAEAASAAFDEGIRKGISLVMVIS